MRLANVEDRLAVVTPDRLIDVEGASDGRFGPDPQQIFGQWHAFQAWVRSGAIESAPGTPLHGVPLGPPAPRPRQVFAVGLNYKEHASEGGYTGPTVPTFFTKFPTCITGQDASIGIPSPRVDWEIELVAVLGEYAYRVRSEDAWPYVAGLTIGQDISARDVQLAGTSPQFSLGKSFPSFGPIGPWLVTPDEFIDPDDVLLECRLNGDVVQHARTSEMILSVSRLIAHLSAVCPLLPGDIIFTGTPAGVGNRRTPPRYLQPGDHLVSTAEGIGSLRTSFVAA